MSQEQHDPGSPFEDWISAAEVARLLNCSIATVSRMGTQGELPREKVNGTYLYDPAAVQARMGSAPGTPQETAATTLAASASLLRALSGLVPELIDRVISMSKAYQESSVALVGQLTERCKTLEGQQTAMLAAREAYLDGTAARELEEVKTAAAIERRDKVVNQLVEQGPAILELAKLFLQKDKDDDNGDAAEIERSGETAE